MAGLDGLRVLDLGDDIAASFCARLLADGGAEVVRVVDPARGNRERMGALEAFLHRNKRRTSVDLATGAGRAALARLCAASDVVVESSRPGTLEALGLGYSSLAATNPALTMVSITAFGQTGPYRHYAADHLAISALGGWACTFGESDREPLQVGFPVMYYMAGIYGAIGALAALRGRRSDGRGQHVDVSALEACLNMLSYPQVLEQFGCPPLRRNFSASLQTFYVQARDGWIALNHLSPSQWESTCILLGVPHLAADPTLLSDMDRKRAIVPEFMTAANAWASDKTQMEAFYAAQELQIPAGIAYTPREMLDCDQFRARDFMGRGHQPGLGEFLLPCAPFRSASLRTESRAAPTRDERIDDWLRGAGQAVHEPGAPGTATTVKDLLAGLRIADLTHYRSGPTGTSLLGGLGADVIKIEAMQRPDGFRFFNTSKPGDPLFYEMGSYFNASNTNKRGITLDMNSAQGKELFTRLIAKSDVVIDNFSPRVLGNLGFGPARLGEINPGIVMISMSCFGHTGPWRDFVGFGYVFDQIGGAAAVSGYEGGSPTHMMAASDVTSGIFAVYAALLALEERDRTGRGQFIDVSQVESLAFLLGPEIIECQLTGQVTPRMGNHHPVFSPHNVYPCRGEDEWVSISVETDAQWAALVEVMGRDDWLRDPRFSSFAARKEHERALDLEISAWTREQGKRDVMERLQARGVIAGAVLKPLELLDDPQLEARGMHRALAREYVGEHRYPGFPLRFSQARCEQRSAAPTLGQHNAEVLTGLLDVSPLQLGELQRAGVIGDRLVKR
ncbi:MAG: Formyl-CoA:oxalate CoA-transferase [Steroidobacteraceae bacterium]|nr:Formyl-CoA:oxalate CoA-transferase [Steroidobacteraceae bacterium]